ncbi:MAG: ABC transporter permease [Clostridia bacterium]
MNIFKNLYNYRELIKTSVKKDIGGKYKHSFLGVLWSFINPLLQIAVYAIIFPLIMKNNIPNYTVFMVCGLIPWNYFATVINRASFTFIENGNIIKKVYFPREILPLSLVTSETINFLISTIIIICFTLAYGMGLTKYVLLYPLVLLVQYILLLGISLIVSSVTVYFRDLQHFIGVLLQLFFYATPIVYSVETIPENFRWILKINPMTYIIEGFRDIFYYHQIPDVKMLGIVLVIGILLCIVGYLIFNKLQKKFAEEL